MGFISYTIRYSVQKQFDTILIKICFHKYTYKNIPDHDFEIKCLVWVLSNYTIVYLEQFITTKRHFGSQKPVILS